MITIKQKTKFIIVIISILIIITLLINRYYPKNFGILLDKNDEIIDNFALNIAVTNVANSTTDKITVNDKKTKEEVYNYIADKKINKTSITFKNDYYRGETIYIFHGYLNFTIVGNKYISFPTSSDKSYYKFVDNDFNMEELIDLIND